MERGSLGPMDLSSLAREVTSCLSEGSRVVRLSPATRAVFVGDVHGDLDAVERVFSLEQASAIVFLGDLVDRGPASRDVLATVLAAKLERPASVHVLMGNHEAWGQTRFHPADFWESLSPGEEACLAAALLRLPFAAWHPAGVLALHGALPDLPSVDSIDLVKPGGQDWRDITWGDWRDDLSEGDRPSSRPCHGAADFAWRSKRLGVRVLVRSHQPDAPLFLYGDQCLTLFTSSAYGDAKRIAALPPGRAILTARDLDLILL